MILQALYKLYGELAKQNKVPRNGWYIAKVSHILLIDPNGELVSIDNCRGKILRGQKEYEVPIEKQSPYLGVRTSAVKPYFLVDTPKYLLGLDPSILTEQPTNSVERTIECFEASKILHTKLLSDCKSPIAQAICLFYKKWDLTKAKNNPIIASKLDDLWKANNLMFAVKEADGNIVNAIDDPDIQAVWDNYATLPEGETHVGPCLVTGKSNQNLAVVHPIIKGISKDKGPFVSYNIESFCSQGYTKDDQALNASISQKAAMGYSAALNYLLSDVAHKKNIAGTTVVYWAEHGISAYQDLLAKCNFGDGIKEEDNINNLMEEISKGNIVEINNVKIDPKETFYVLGLEMNTSRIMVRFFYKNSFGNIINNIRKYQIRLQIIGAPQNRPISPWFTVKAAFNSQSKDSDHASILLSSLLYAIFTNTPYPEGLYRNILMRVYATHDNKEKGKGAIRKIDYVKAGYIKAYLLKNHPNRWDKEGGIQMIVNENCNEKSYVLGRIFAILESIQEAVNPGLNSTIKDRYFNGCSTTPGKVFPLVLKLTNAHLQKLEKTKKGLAVNLQKKLGNLMAKIEMPDNGTPFPARLTLEEQGAFLVGYYQERKDRFEVKDKVQEEEDNE